MQGVVRGRRAVPVVEVGIAVPVHAVRSQDHPFNFNLQVNRSNLARSNALPNGVHAWAETASEQLPIQLTSCEKYEELMR